jgi:hypothetical protein
MGRLTVGCEPAFGADCKANPLAQLRIQCG